MLMDRQPSVYSYVTEQEHVKRSHDGTVVNESDVLHCERPRLWLDHTKLETQFRTAEKHELVNADCNGASDPDREVSRRTKIASVKHKHALVR